MDELSAWLEQERGRQNRLAQHLGLKQPVVAAWVSGKRPIPVVHAAAIEAFTGGVVSRQALFPKDWKRIWPELEAYQAVLDAQPPLKTEEAGHV